MNILKVSLLGLVGLIGLVPNLAQAEHRHGGASYYRHSTYRQPVVYHRPVMRRFVSHHVYPRPVYYPSTVVYRPVYPVYQPVEVPCDEQGVEPIPSQGWQLYMNSGGQVGVQVHSRW